MDGSSGSSPASTSSTPSPPSSAVVRAQARIDTGAIERNCARLAALAPLCAVVKADGYGHGAVAAARAAQRGGAAYLAVATAEEAAELRAAQIGGPRPRVGGVLAGGGGGPPGGRAGG